VFRNSLSQALYFFYGYIGQDTNNAAELEGLIHGLQLASNKDWFPLIVEGDSKIILRMAANIQNGQAATKVSNHWRLEGRLERLVYMMKSPEACTWSHVRRKGNKVADRLANLGVDARVHFWHGPMRNLPSREIQEDCQRLIEQDWGHPEAGDRLHRARGNAPLISEPL